MLATIFFYGFYISNRFVYHNDDYEHELSKSIRGDDYKATANNLEKHPDRGYTKVGPVSGFLRVANEKSFQTDEAPERTA